MNSETDIEDLEDLELAEEVDQVFDLPEIEENIEEDVTEKAQETVLGIIDRNVFDLDLKNSLKETVAKHFEAVKPYSTYNADNFKIPDLNKEIWEAFHDYESFVYKNKFENINLNEIGQILREVVVPEITNTLRDLTIRQAQ